MRQIFIPRQEKVEKALLLSGINWESKILSYCLYILNIAIDYLPEQIIVIVCTIHVHVYAWLAKHFSRYNMVDECASSPQVCALPSAVRALEKCANSIVPRSIESDDSY